MRKFVSSLSVITILVWVLPLGVFIKPSQEKTVCGGKRAFHMCHMAKASATSQNESTKITLNTAGQSGQEKEKGGSSGNEMQLDEITRSAREKYSFYHFNESLPYRKSLSRLIFRPPITTLF